MAKIYGLFGAMTGKLADTVMSVRNGEQIARKYQPVVYNPSTPAQVAQRAKLKLLSQLSAVMAPVIAIPRQGSVSSRNLFTKKNFPAITYDSALHQAQVTLSAVQLTRGVIPLGNLSVLRAETYVSVALQDASVPSDIDRVVYALFAKATDDSMEFRGSVIASTRGTEESVFNADLPAEPRAFVVYAYGIRDNNENARATFGNLLTPTAETVAKLITTSTLTESDITLTKTSSYSAEAQTQNFVTPVDGNRSVKKK